jgi:hypothetical protein
MDTGERQIAVADLRLSLYLRAIHPEFFAIRAGRAFKQASFEGDVWLLDAGHVITFVYGSDAITEVIAPRELELPKRGLVRTLDLAGDREHRMETRGAILYQMALQVDVESPDTYLKEAEELLASARQGQLFTETPPDAPRRQFSYAVSELRGRGLLVHAWHGFPAENTILKTQTLIERIES